MWLLPSRTPHEGVIQEAAASFASQSMNNSGTIALSAKATATAEEVGKAFASASAMLAMGQRVSGGSAREFMLNSGVVSLAASANAIGVSAATAFALATIAMGQRNSVVRRPSRKP